MFFRFRFLATSCSPFVPFWYPLNTSGLFLGRSQADDRELKPDEEEKIILQPGVGWFLKFSPAVLSGEECLSQKIHASSSWDAQRRWWFVLPLSFQTHTAQQWFFKINISELLCISSVHVILIDGRACSCVFLCELAPMLDYGHTVQQFRIFLLFLVYFSVCSWWHHWRNTVHPLIFSTVIIYRFLSPLFLLLFLPQLVATETIDQARC